MEEGLPLGVSSLIKAPFAIRGRVDIEVSLEL